MLTSGKNDAKLLKTADFQYLRLNISE